MSNTEGGTGSSDELDEVVPILLTVVSPTDGQLVSDELTITATVQSETDISGVTVVMGERMATLTY